MSPKVVFEQWVSQHAIRFIAYAIAIGVAWGALTAAVGGKAEKSDVEEIRRDIRDVKDLVCELQQYKDKRSCQR